MTTAQLLAAWEPSAADPFDLRKAGHLVRRVALGGSLELRRRMVRRGLDWAIQRVTETGAGEDADAVFDNVVAMADARKLRAYRVWRLLHGRRRLRERMSLFWHGHFATSIGKVDNTRMMAYQLALFDARGLGRFDDLALEVSRDPAMIRWLDNETNVAGRANENYARELFELFALGRGNYTERDIQEAARAFTGWHLRNDQFVFVKRFHDDGEKTLFGETGRLGGEEVVALTVRREASARFLASKWLAEFVHPEPSDQEVSALAQVYVDSGRDVGATLKTLVKSRLFFSPRAYRSRIKSPADFAVGMVRSCGARAAPLPLAEAMGRLGQYLVAPPTVEGWPRERAWISSATWLLRSNLAAELFSGRGGYRLDPVADELLSAADGDTERAGLALRIMLDGDVSDESREAITAFAKSPAGRGPGGAGALLHAVQNLPEAQLL